MIEPARVLLVAAVLALSALAAFAWPVGRAESGSPERLIGQLRLAQWAAILLASGASIAVGLALTSAEGPILNLDVTVGVAAVVLTGVVMQSEPRTALTLVAVGSALHALTMLAHRPGFLSPTALPRWFVAGCAVYDVVLGGMCFWARRR